MLPCMSIQDDFRKAIHRDGRTQREIAKAADIHFVTLARYLTTAAYRQQMPLHIAERLAEAIDHRLTLVPKTSRRRPPKPR
jgi:hypothetical protein